MAISDITKPMALDETLQGTNTKMDAVILKLQGIIDALGLDTSVYKPKGNIVCAALVPALLVDDNLGNVYNVTDNGTTTSDFVEGAGKPIRVGDNVAIVDIGTGGQSEYKFDLLAGMVDLTNYVQKSSTAGLLKNDGSVDTNTYATTSQVSGKADKVTSATNGNLAGLNASGNLTDSGWNGAKDTTSISGNPISIPNLKSNQLAIKPIITLEPIQAGSGTPSPSNIRTISGYDRVEADSLGKNLFNPDRILAGTYSNGTWQVTTAQADAVYKIAFKENTRYTFSGYEQQSAASKNIRLTVKYSDGTESNIFIDSGTTKQAFSFTSDENKTIIAVGRGYASGSGSPYCEITEFQIEEGTSKTTYEAPNPITSITESLGQTVYGGTLDVRTGKLLSNMLYISLKGKTASAYGADGILISNVLDRNARGLQGVCSHGVIAETWSWGDNEIYLGYNDKVFYWKNALTLFGMTLAEFNTWLASNDIWVCYEAETPATIQLTPHEISLLKDYAYVSTNGTTIALDYHNGELASLGDVNQLAETVERLMEYIKGLINNA